VLEAFVGVILWTEGDYVLISTSVFDIRALLLRNGAEARLVITLDEELI
jgi:hypothetical protein